MPLLLNGTNLEYAKAEIHLGITRTQDSKANSSVEARIKCGRRTAYALMGAGLHGLNGISPKVSIMIVDTYVLPAVLHGLDCLILSQQNYNALNKFHRYLIRKLQCLPLSTAIPAIYLLTGSIPIEVHHHRAVLNLFGNVIRRDGSAERAVITRQLATKSMNSNSWTTLVRELLQQYSLPNAYELCDSVPTKEKWKSMVKKAVHVFWDEKLKEEAKKKSSLSFLNLESCHIGKVHAVWHTGDDPLQATMAATKVRLLTQRYILYGTSRAGKQQQTECPMCKGPPETLTHFLLTCPTLEKTRRPVLENINSLITEFYLDPENDHEKLQIILDPSFASWIPAEIAGQLERLSRQLCFRLHNQRSIALGQPSQFTAARLRRR